MYTILRTFFFFLNWQLILAIRFIEIHTFFQLSDQLLSISYLIVDIPLRYPYTDFYLFYFSFDWNLTWTGYQFFTLLTAIFVHPILSYLDIFGVFLLFIYCFIGFYLYHSIFVLNLFQRRIKFLLLPNFLEGILYSTFLLLGFNNWHSF